MIHTLAPPKVREMIGEVLLAPVQPWDALICTSPAVRQCLEGFWIAGRRTSASVLVESVRRGPSCLCCRWASTRRLYLEQRTDQRSP